MQKGEERSSQGLAGGPVRLRAPESAYSHVPSGLSNEYDFVNGTLVDRATLERAVDLARRWNVTPHDVLIANGWVRPDDYYRALAQDCGAEFVEARDADSLSPFSHIATPREALRSQLLRRVRNGRVDVAYAPGAARAGRIEAAPSGGYEPHRHHHTAPSADRDTKHIRGAA